MPALDAAGAGPSFMARDRTKLGAEERAAIALEARERVNDAWAHDRDNRREAALDFRFLANDQWPELVRTERLAAGRPLHTINLLSQFLRQVTNDIRQADIAIKTAPVDDSSDPKLARIYDGLIKQIEYQSSASAVYAAAAEHQAGCGIGWFRIVTQYVDDDASFDQELRLKSIRNPLAVYCDPAAIEPDRSDANWIVVTEMVPRKAFKQRYPDASPTGLEGTSDRADQTSLYWFTNDDVRIGEYWRKVPTRKQIALLGSGETVDITGRGEAELGALDQAVGIVAVRTVTTYRIESYIVSGNEVLEGPFAWPGKYIPVVPVIGAEVPLERITYRHGVIRFAREPQQIFNYYVTAASEAIGQAPKAPYLVTDKMIGKYRGIWDTANVKNRPYLPFEPDPAVGGGRPAREHPPEPPIALVQGADQAQSFLHGTTGIYPPSLGARSNETSGVAIANRQREGDVSNYHYIDNLKRSLEYAGRILIDLIPRIYDNQRVVRLLGEQNEEEFVPINHVLMGVGGMPVMVNDLSQGRFDIRVTVARSYTTRRMEAADALGNFAKVLPPQQAMLIPDLIAKNLDFPDAEEAAKRLKKTVPAEILADPDDPNAPPPPDPMDNPIAKAQLDKIEAEIREIRARAYERGAAGLQKFIEMGMPPPPGPVPGTEPQPAPQATAPPPGPAPGMPPQGLPQAPPAPSGGPGPMPPPAA